MFTVTLVYAVAVGFQLATSYSTRLSSIDLFELPAPDQGVLTLLGLDLVSDTTAVAGVSALTRTVVLQTNAQGDQMYLNADAVKAATRNLFKSALSTRMPATVAAAEPTVV